MTAGRYRALVAGALALYGAASCNRLPPPDLAADLVLTNARVYTLSWGEPDADGRPAANAPHDSTGWRPDAEAIAIRDGRIVFVGSLADASRIVRVARQLRDLGGATVLPGL